MNEQTILNAISDMKREMKNDMESINKNLNEKFSELNIELTDTRNKQKIIEERIINNEKDLKKRNILIYNLRETENNIQELEVIIVDLVNHTLETGLKIEEIDFMYRLGKKTQSKTRPILLGLTTYRKKCEIMSNKSKLRSLQHKIFLADDLPKEVVEERKKTRSVLSTLKEGGVDAKIVKGKIFADNQPLSNEVINEINNQAMKKKRQRSEEDEKSATNLNLNENAQTSSSTNTEKNQINKRQKGTSIRSYMKSMSTDMGKNY